VLFIKNVLFIIFIPGTAAVLIPYWIAGSNSVISLKEWGALQYFALVPVLLGLLIYAHCAWFFAYVGHGTPFPLDPPKVLIVYGLFQYVRNPMYLGVMLLIMGESVLYESWHLLIYACGILLCFHLWVVFYEEKDLRRRFGDSYAHYCSAVRRWLPGGKYRQSVQHVLEERER
jgi:protein-S-isoprenylcysteine O-methyltransferase Ste14